MTATSFTTSTSWKRSLSRLSEGGGLEARRGQRAHDVLAASSECLKTAQDLGLKRASGSKSHKKRHKLCFFPHSFRPPGAFVVPTCAFWPYCYSWRPPGGRRCAPTLQRLGSRSVQEPLDRQGSSSPQSAPQTTATSLGAGALLAPAPSRRLLHRRLA